MPVKKLSKVTKGTMTSRNPESIINELETLKANKKLIEKREEELKKELGVILEAEGTKDNKGSFNLIIGDIKAQKQARKTVKLNPEKAEELFKELGIWKDVTETKTVIKDDLVEQAVVDEKLSMDDLEKVTDIKVTYAIVIGKYEPEQDEMPEIKQS
jgi:hypothetical protein